MKNRIVVLGLMVTAWAMLSMPAARAETYSFVNITNNNAADAALAGQFSVVVTDAGGGQVSFKFMNSGPGASSITDVYFDDGTLLGIASINESAGVSFSQGASPPDLPGGNELSPPFQVTAGFLADSDPAVQLNGVNPGEWVEIIFDLQAGQTFQSVLDDLASGKLRIGIKVQGFEDDGSESFVNNGAVPEPSSLLLLGTGLMCLGFTLRKLK